MARTWWSELVIGKSAKYPRGRAQVPQRRRPALPVLERLEERSLLASVAPANILVSKPGDDRIESDTHSETSLVAFTRDSHVNVVVAFNDSGSTAGGRSQYTGYAFSTDDGQTFADQGTLPPSTDNDAGDPSMARHDASGKIYLSTLVPDENTSRIQVFRSLTNGQTWQAPVNGAPGHQGFLDKEWLTVDNSPADTGTGNGNVYLAVREFANGDSDVWFRREGTNLKGPKNAGENAIWFHRSTDGGVTWSNPGVRIVAAGDFNVQGAWVTVGRDHAVYVFWYDTTQGQPRIYMRKSTDEGATFAAARRVVTLNSTRTNGDLNLTVSNVLGSRAIRSNSFPQVVASPTNANFLYMVYNDDPQVAGNKADVYLVTSANGGTDWGAPVRVNNNTQGDQWFPTLAVTPNGNKLGIFWYDRRLDPNNRYIHRFAALGDIAGNGTVTFAANNNYRITDIDGRGFDALVGVDPILNTKYMGDYDQVVADNNNFYTVWSDNRDDSARATRKMANVRFAKVSVGAKGPQGITVAPVRPPGLDDPINRVRVTFSHTVLASTFTTDQARLTDPYGYPVPVQQVMEVPDSYGTQFDIVFPTQSLPGNYTLTVGPYIQDPDGLFMDQNLNGIDGEPEDDVYISTFTTDACGSSLANGGFEAGDLSCWAVTGDPQSMSVTGYHPHTGYFSAQLGSLNVLNFLSQTVATIPGQQYQLVCWLAHDVYPGTPNEFQVSIGGTVVFDAMDLPPFPYTPFVFNYIATAPSTTIQFGIREDASSFYLDDVSFQPVNDSPANSPSSSPAALFPKSRDGLGGSRPVFAPATSASRASYVPPKTDLADLALLWNFSAALPSGHSSRAVAVYDALFRSTDPGNFRDGEMSTTLTL